MNVSGDFAENVSFFQVSVNDSKRSINLDFDCKEESFQWVKFLGSFLAKAKFSLIIANTTMCVIKR